MRRIATVLLLASLGLVGCGGSGGGGTSGLDAALFSGPLMFMGTQMRIYGEGESLEVASLNGDAVPDLLWAQESPTTDIISAVGGALGSSTALLEPSTLVLDNCYGFRVADFDQDGENDITCFQIAELTRGELTLELVVHFGSGDGTFESSSVLAELSPTDVIPAIGDVNGDTRPDIVVRAEDTIAWVSTGPGEFSPFHSIGVPAYFESRLADINEDTWADLVVVAFGEETNPICIALSRGDGTFETATEVLPFGNTFYVDPVDLNGDGDPDFVGSPDDSIIAVHLGMAGAEFAPALNSIVSVGLPDDELNVAWVGDLDEDDVPDLIVRADPPGSGDRPLLLALGNGDGTFQSGIQIAPNVDGSVLAADMDQDGHIDLLLPFSGFVRILFGNGDGTFRNAEPESVTISEASRLSLSDIDADGNLDILAFGNDPTTELLYGNGDLSFDRIFMPSAGNFDLDDDGDEDFILHSDTDSVATILRNYGARDIRALPPIPFFDAGMIGVYSAQDVDADGATDIVFRQVSMPLSKWVAYGLGDMQFEPMAPLCDFNCEIHDITGDGLPDLVRWVRVDEALVLRVRPAVGERQYGEDVDTALPDNTDDILYLEMNGDDRTDFIIGAYIGNSSVRLQTFIAQSDGTFTAGAPADLVYSLVDFGDINGDGIMDAVAVTALLEPENVMIPLLGDANGNFTEAPQILLFNQLGNPILNAELVDINGDTMADLVARHLSSGTVAVALADGGGNFKGPYYFAFPETNGWFEFGDLDNDGDVDFTDVTSEGSAALIFENQTFGQ